MIIKFPTSLADVYPTAAGENNVRVEAPSGQYLITDICRRSSETVLLATDLM